MQHTTALVPPSPDQLGGPFVNATDGFRILARRDKAVIVEFYERPDGVEWFDEFELLYCHQQHDADAFKVIRKATEDERKLFRIPLWIQGEEVPECCGRPMHFVGQIDDDRICAERPSDAKMWWHDAASFYVFTCSHAWRARRSASSSDGDAACRTTLQGSGPPRPTASAAGEPRRRACASRWTWAGRCR